MGENGARMCSPCSETVNRLWKKGVPTTVYLFFIFLFIGAFISTHWTDLGVITGASFQTSKSPKEPRKRIEIPLSCSTGNITQTCPENYPATHETEDSSAEACPEYFRWIHEDLRPWKNTGITRDMVERAQSAAHFRLVIVNGKVYVEKYKWVYQTRDVFTIWGILQLLRLYPGKLPDLDVMFECGDKPVINKRDYQGPNATTPPALFHYCGDDGTLDIVFPDWSFWGWPEINIKPWESLRKDLEEGNNRSKWMKREPYAYWRGNRRMGAARQELFRCNPTDIQDWNARIYDLDWNHESRKGFKGSNIASQCTHRYKIYIEGAAWSVSGKFILACDSVSLLVNPHYYDFFMRSLLPMIHYWPINEDDKCRSIKFAVDWGNNHTQKVQEIGKAGSKFIQEELKMNHVYDYMFHLLYKYAKLLKYKPTVPPRAVELCSETMACPTEGLEKAYKIETMVKGPADTSPCTMPPYDPLALQAFLERKENITKIVEMREASGNIGEKILGN